MLGALGQTLRRREAHLHARLLSLETRLAELRSDVEATLTLEVGGQLAYFETRIETKLDDFVADLWARLAAEPKA